MSAKKQKTSWSDKYASEFGFIEKVADDDQKAYCKICSTKFSISHGRKSDIQSHIKSKRHEYSISNANSSKKVDSFFKKIEATNDHRSKRSHFCLSHSIS